METATAPRKAREQARPVEAKDDARAPARTALRPGEVMGRNGEILSRVGSMSSDQFEIPSDITREIDADGYCLQWCRSATVGQEDRTNITRQMQAGWRPVEASRFAGRFMPKDHKGPVENGGLMLCERPKQFNELALKEMQGDAREQKNRQLVEFGMRAPPPGFEEKRRVRRDLEGTPSEIAPRHRLELDDA